MTERQTYQRYSEARADYDAMPSYYNACDLLKWALKLGAISDEYDHLVDEAHDIMDSAIG